MGRPQQPELARSSKTDIDPDHVETGLQGQKGTATGGETGPVPPDNRPGHHPAKEQDKPDLDAFAARLGTDPDAPTATAARKGPAKATTAKKAPAPKAATPTAPPKSGPGKAAPPNAGPAKEGTRPKASPAKAETKPKTATPKGEPKPTPEPARPPAPTLRASAEEAAQISAPQPEPEKPRESFLTTMMLLPLRQTVKGLEQLDRTLTARLEGKRRPD